MTMTFPIPPAWVCDATSFANWLATGPGVVSEYAREIENWLEARDDLATIEASLDDAGAALEDRLPPMADTYVAMTAELVRLATLGAVTLGTLEACGALTPDDAKDPAYAAVLLGALLPAIPAGQGS